MADLLSDCNSQQLISDQEFQQVFCVRCRNAGCQLAAWGNSTFDRRVATQVDRLFNAQQADPRLPKYAKILAAEFTEMLEHAMRIEVASQRNDWEVPEINIIDGQIEQAPSQTTATVDDAVAGLSCSETAQADSNPEQPVASEEVASEERLPEASPPLSRHPPKIFVPPKVANTPQQLGGVLIGGGSESLPEAEIDPWAAPPPKPKTVPVGAKIRMGEPSPEKKGP